MTFTAENLKGYIFGRLTVIERDGAGASGNAKWRCLCECGKTKTVIAADLKRGQTRSCGCLHRDISAGLARPASPVSRKIRMDFSGGMDPDF